MVNPTTVRDGMLRPPRSGPSASVFEGLAARGDVETELTGKVALVVGGGTGIGRATAVEFAREGAFVVVAGRRERLLSEVVDQIGTKGGRALAVPTDVSQPASVLRVVNAAIDEFGGLDAVANCAGMVDREETMLTGAVADFDRVIDVNLRGSWLVVRAAGQAMIDLGKPGALVTVSSINAMRPGTVDYSTSKAGVEGLTRAAAMVLGPHGVRVNTVRSGFIDTDMLRYAWDVPPGVPFPIGPSEQVNVPLGRVGQPSETAQAIVWLCSSAASYVTGSCLDVDGGALIA
jgi:NAD(P)-dependent dehydrogenase (short-subunit alcohol dehydrogenase family)